MKHALLPQSVAAALLSAGSWGHLDLIFDQVEDLIVVVGYSDREIVKRPATSQWLGDHYTRMITSVPSSGVWYRTDPDLHDLGKAAARRGAMVKIDAFRQRVHGFRQPHQKLATFAVTLYAKDGAIDFAAWRLTTDGAAYFAVELVPESDDLLQPLGTAWPRSALESKLVTVIGVGSIGSAACEALAGYGARHQALVDPDRLELHNFARHRSLRSQHGRYKVNAVADALRERDPTMAVEKYVLDVADDADVMRPLFTRTACVLVCSDGVESRRVANHLACRADVPAVFACVLEDGAFGELIRVRPHVTACLFCSREKLAHAGALDPEPTLDRGYGIGTRHLPMTAVGSDLDLVGKFAARATVSTLLMEAGYLKEQLPGDHAVIGLRPSRDRQPEPPFDVDRSLAVSWHPLGDPMPDCPSCGNEP